MKTLGLKSNSEELERIMRSKVLFNWYSKMLMEDYELEMSRFKYLGILTNPDGYKKLEEASKKKDEQVNSLYSDGKQATQELQSLITQLKVNESEEEGLEELE